MTTPTPTLLLILDGWGIAPSGPGNAVSLASTPNLNRLFSEYPHTRLNCSGRNVGLPDGFMGNSEVGHMNIGAGRIVYQDMTRIDMALENDELKNSAVLNNLIASANAQGGTLHLMGLLSDGGVHSHLNHLFALLDLCAWAEVKTAVHVFLDGRDTAPQSGLGFLQQLQAKISELGHGEIASITGRYYAMDRDKHWERNQLAYDALTLGRGEQTTDPVAAVEAAYAAGENDEFVKPRVLTKDGHPVATLADGDSVFFFNFRADRARQLVRILFDPEFDGFEREVFPLLRVGTMTRYEASFPLPVAFEREAISNTIGETVSGLGLGQLRIAETEKYAHVTYFMNCGREEPFEGEDRIMVPSPREVATYDEKPEMSVGEVCDKLCASLDTGKYSFVACNLANLDMVGHTGIIQAARAAAEAVDACVGRIVETAQANGFRMLITADHGNAEEMLSASGEAQTSHSKNQVPLLFVEKDRKGPQLRDEGILGDIAPTIISQWGVELPSGMSGQSLVVED